MPAFTLDTSGAVWVDPVDAPGIGWIWSDLDAFTWGYVEALFAGIEYPACQDTEYLPKGFSDLSPEALAAILKDCADRRGIGGMKLGSTEGRLFWASRQDGLWPDRFPPLTVSLGDDGRVNLTTGA